MSLDGPLVVLCVVVAIVVAAFLAAEALLAVTNNTRGAEESDLTLADEESRQDSIADGAFLLAFLVREAFWNGIGSMARALSFKLKKK